MKPPQRQDFRRDKTDPGAAPGSGDAEAPAEDEDEFPSEQTRIEPAGYAGRLAPQKTAPAKTSNAKLAALQSLSLNNPSKSGAQRLPPAPRAQGAVLPWVLLSLVLAAVGANWLWQKKHPSSTQPTTTQTQVRTMVVTAGSATGRMHTAAGYTAARDPIGVGSPTVGLIKEVRVQNGDHIKRGQIIASLDSSVAQSELSVAAAEVRDAERNLARTLQLYRAQAATSIDVDKSRGALEIARAKTRPPSQRIEQAHIRAPIDGTVLEVITHPGESVSVSTTIMKVADLTKIVAEVDIVETDLVKVHRGQEVEVTSEISGDKIYKGEVREIAQQADKTKGTVLVKVDMQVPDLTLRPGMSVRCTFLADKNAAAKIFIPRSAITPQGAVWLVGANHRVSARGIQTQPGGGATAEIVSGLTGGEEIVVDATTAAEGQTINAGP